MTAAHAPTAPTATTAVAAGPPVPFVRLDRDDPELLEELLGAVRAVAEESAFTLGRHVEAFEDEFAAYCEADSAVGVGSGTDALALALRALGVGPGDEVIVPATTFIATAEAVSAFGARPRLVDVDPASGLLTAAAVEGALGPRVRCVIPVHLYGATVDMEPILDVARAAGIAVIEDACQAHGARYRGRRVGTLGDAGCFSFYPAKNLGAWGDGGAVVTDRPELADRVRLLRSHGERPRYRHRVVGTTARLDGLQAAVLRIKLRRLEGWNDQRRRAAAALRAALRAAGAAVQAPAEAIPGGDHVHHLFVVRCDDRDGLRDGLARRGVASAVHYPVPVHRAGAYAHLGLGEGSLPASEAIAARVCSLPMFPSLTAAEIERVAAAVADVAGVGP
jgi:dTDP-3-amino-3,4,6-trideoxy-alpha-D-glucose transaminase